MKNWLKENWLRISISTISVLVVAYFFSWQVLSTVVLAITAVFIAIQALETRRMVKNQMMPIVDVGMIFDKAASKTRLQFLNVKKIPTLVWLSLNFEVEGKNVDLDDTANSRLIGKRPIRLVGSRSYITAPGFFKEFTAHENAGKTIRAHLKIEVAPLSDEKSKSLLDKKTYRFDFVGRDWIDDDWWGVPDPLYQVLER